MDVSKVPEQSKEEHSSLGSLEGHLPELADRPLLEEILQLLRWQRADLFTRYNVLEVDKGIVSFTIPRGVSFFQLYLDCNAYSQTFWDRRIISPQVFSTLREDESFYAPMIEDTVEIVTGALKGSIAINRAEQEKLLKAANLSYAPAKVLIAAAALYYCRTYSDLLNEHQSNSETPELWVELNQKGAYDFGTSYRDGGLIKTVSHTCAVRGVAETIEESGGTWLSRLASRSSSRSNGGGAWPGSGYAAGG